MNAVKWSVPALAVMLAACGGDSSSDVVATQSNSQTGVFTDSAVAGIYYETETRSGYTNALGEYKYQEGETVTFSIGGTPLPPVPATGRVTPADMTVDGQPDTVTNILRLLQTLDDDGNPDNGITISETTHADFTGVELDVTGAAATFEGEAQTAIGETLVSAADAEAHFEASQQADLRGSWIFVEPEAESSGGLGPNGEEITVLTFLDGGRYILAHKYGNEDEDPASAEWGTYSWDPQSGDFGISVQGESDGNGGLSDLPTGDTVQLVDDELLLGSEAGAQTPFQRITDAKNPRVGAWYLKDGTDFHVLTILDNSEYVIAHSNNAEAYGIEAVVPVSSEWGTYSFSGGQFSVTGVTTETDGNGGLYDAENVGAEGLVADLEATAWGDLQIDPTDEGPFAMRRIGRFLAELKDFAGVSSQVVVERLDDGVFENGTGKGFEYDMVGEGTVSQVTLVSDGTGTIVLAAGSPDEEDSVIDAPWVVTETGALDYYETFYAPNNAILVVAGDVQPQEVLALAQKHFGPLPANPDLGPR
ncbi:MAG: insulinase family protein, partial [Alcanivoracaceae bacterium]